MIKVYTLLDSSGVVSGFSIDAPTGVAYASNQLDMDNENPMKPCDVVVENNIARLRTEVEIISETTRVQAEYDGQAYARSRKAKYDLLNQDEMRYDDLVNSTTTWQDAIASIKLEYPK